MFALWHRMAQFKCHHISSDWTERTITSVGSYMSEEQRKQNAIWEVLYCKDGRENESTRILVFKGCCHLDPFYLKAVVLYSQQSQQQHPRQWQQDQVSPGKLGCVTNYPFLLEPASVPASWAGTGPTICTSSIWKMDQLTLCTFLGPSKTLRILWFWNHEQSSFFCVFFRVSKAWPASRCLLVGISLFFLFGQSYSWLTCICVTNGLFQSEWSVEVIPEAVRWDSWEK